jgi:type II secretory pathway pseudopilin PulG
MKHYKVKQYTRQAGMTLIELTVVLLVLIGLAGMLLPYVGGFVDKTHDSANSSSEKELAAAIQRFDVQFARLPDNMDSLMRADGTLINYFIAQRMTGNAAQAGTAYGMTPFDITAAAADMMGATATAGKAQSICASLRKAGINSSKAMDAAADLITSPPVGTALLANFNPTFNYYTHTTAAPTDFNWGPMGACSGFVVELTNAAKVAQAVGVDVTEINNKITDGHTFVAFGMGTGSELMGRTVQDAPVHFAKNGEFGPTNAYNRLLAIFEVDASTTKLPTSTNLDRAKFLGTAMAMHDLLGVSSSLANYHKGMTE